MPLRPHFIIPQGEPIHMWPPDRFMNPTRAHDPLWICLLLWESGELRGPHGVHKPFVGNMWIDPTFGWWGGATASPVVWETDFYTLLLGGAALSDSTKLSKGQPLPALEVYKKQSPIVPAGFEAAKEPWHREEHSTDEYWCRHWWHWSTWISREIRMDQWPHLPCFRGVCMDQWPWKFVKSFSRDWHWSMDRSSQWQQEAAEIHGASRPRLGHARVFLHAEYLLEAPYKNPFEELLLRTLPKTPSHKWKACASFVDTAQNHSAKMPKKAKSRPKKCTTPL